MHRGQIGANPGAEPPRAVAARTVFGKQTLPPLPVSRCGQIRLDRLDHRGPIAARDATEEHLEMLTGDRGEGLG